ncbi:hypothetical protein D3C72_1610970 [compost metagenome]
MVSGLPALHFLRPLKCTPAAWAASSTSVSRLWMALWLVAAMPTRLPCCKSATIMREPEKVLPAPGGPWMIRVLSSRCVAMPRMSTRSSASPCSLSPGVKPCTRGWAPISKSLSARYGPGPSMPWSTTD